MLTKTVKNNQSSMFLTLVDMLNPNHPLFILSNTINWKILKILFLFFIVKITDDHQNLLD